MVSVNTLRLIDALFAGSDEAQKNRLIGLYKTAFAESENYKKLRWLFDTCEFYGVVGEDLQRQAKSIFEESFTDAESFSSKLTVMDFIINRAEDERNKTEEYVNSARMDNETLSVVEKTFAAQIADFYTVLVNYLCCVYASLYGKDVIRGMNADLHTGALDLVRSLTDELCAVDMEVMEEGKPKFWKITREHFGGLNAVQYDGFCLEYINEPPEKILSGCERVAPFIYTDSRDDGVLCYGIGKITNLTFRDGAKILGAEIIEKPAMNCLDEYDIVYRNFSLLSIMNMLFNGKVCLILPEDMVEILNRYFMIKETKIRKDTGKCILCGGTGCKHFDIPKDYIKEKTGAQ